MFGQSETLGKIRAVDLQAQMMQPSQMSLKDSVQLRISALEAQLQEQQELLKLLENNPEIERALTLLHR